jgi:hypothetical protein
MHAAWQLFTLHMVLKFQITLMLQSYICKVFFQVFMLISYMHNPAVCQIIYLLLSVMPVGDELQISLLMSNPMPTAIT